MLPYVNREYPFREGLELSGRSVAGPLTPRAPMPEGPVSRWGDAPSGGWAADRFRSGGTGAMVGDATLYEAAVAAGEFGGVRTAAAAAAAPGGYAAAAPPVAAQGLPPSAVLQVSFRSWLSGMEDSMFVIQYHDAIAAQFDSLSQLADLYVKDGELDSRFFEAAGISKLGHKRVRDAARLCDACSLARACADALE